MKKKPYKQSKSAPFLVDSAPLLTNQHLQERIERMERELHQLRKLVVQDQQEIPVSLFNTQLSTLEVLAKYLHEVQEKSFADIARLLNRDQRTIWHAYNRAVTKKASIAVNESPYTILLSLFAQRKFSALEVLVSYLRERYSLSFVEIGSLLQLHPKTVWTSYHRKQHKQKLKPSPRKPGYDER